MARNSQVSRIYKILNILEASRYGMSASDITARLADRGFEVTKRTVYRDLEALKAAGFPLDEKGRDSDNGAQWTLENTTKLSHYLVLNSRELMALYLARGMLSPLKETPFFDDLTSTFNKIEEKLGDKGQNFLSEMSSELKFEAGPKWGLGLDPDIIDTIRSACTERHQLKINYSSNNSKTVRDRILGPHFLYFSKGSLYLVAEDLEERKNKVFSLTRVNKAQMLAESYKAEELDASDFFEGSFGVFQSTDILDIELEFSYPVSTYIKEKRWHKSQQLVCLENDKVLLKLELSINPEFVHWVLGFGGDVKVIKPESLKEEILAKTRDIIEVYKEIKKVS